MTLVGICLSVFVYLIAGLEAFFSLPFVLMRQQMVGRRVTNQTDVYLNTGAGNQIDRQDDAITAME